MLIKKSEIEKTKPNFVIATFKTDITKNMIRVLQIFVKASLFEEDRDFLTNSPKILIFGFSTYKFIYTLLDKLEIQPHLKVKTRN